jgi:protein phosphatase PTC6
VALLVQSSMCASTIRNFRIIKGRWAVQRNRHFHDYFITHLPSSSLHPDARSTVGPRHGLPRDKSSPHVSDGKDRSPSAPPPMVGTSREMTVVRIPIRSAKHHFGVSLSRGSRPYNEDAFQVGTIDIPPFAKRRPISLTRSGKSEPDTSVTPAGNARGDPQVFYFGVFDGHGGSECSNFLKDELHKYVEDGASLFELESSLMRKGNPDKYKGWRMSEREEAGKKDSKTEEKKESDSTPDTVPSAVEPLKPPPINDKVPNVNAAPANQPLPLAEQSSNIRKAEELERGLVQSWRELVGGYYKRFKPEYFSLSAGGQGHLLEKEAVKAKQLSDGNSADDIAGAVGLETVLTYAFLKADYDFVSAQADKQDEDPVMADRPLNDDELFHNPSYPHRKIGGPKRFKGGSTCSIALISTPTPTPFWHPSSPCTIMTAHVGDTRVILCTTATGLAVPMTTNHHPSVPGEAARLRRYAATFVTDSFGEERVSGLANTRAFGDMASKRIGVSAEPEIRRIDILPAEFSFLVLVSDGISGHLGDQEIVDIVKEARTPEQGARDLVSFATEVSSDADNATALVVRLGGWERRSEGGVGSLGTKELRDWRKEEAENPRGRR